MREVVVEATVKILMMVDDDIEAEEVVADMDYEFIDRTDKATIEDTEIIEWNISDSK